MTTIEEIFRAEARAAVDDALRPYLPRLSKPEQRSYNFTEAGHVIGCSSAHVAKLVARGVLPLVPHMGAKKLIPRRAVEHFVDGQFVETSAPEVLGGAGADVSTIERQAS